MSVRSSSSYVNGTKGVVGKAGSAPARNREHAIQPSERKRLTGTLGKRERARKAQPLCKLDHALELAASERCSRLHTNGVSGTPVSQGKREIGSSLTNHFSYSHNVKEIAQSW